MKKIWANTFNPNYKYTQAGVKEKFPANYHSNQAQVNECLLPFQDSVRITTRTLKSPQDLFENTRVDTSIANLSDFVVFDDTIYHTVQLKRNWYKCKNPI